MTISYWRTKSGLEIDFVLDQGRVAIEVKGNAMIRQTDLKALLAFHEEHQPRRCIVVCNELLPRIIGNIELMPWRHFLEMFWLGRIV